MAQKFLLVIDDKTYSDYMNGVIDRLVPEFRMDNVAYHRQLLNEPLERALGGGVYEFSADRKTLLLSDKSYDYGIPQCLYPDKFSVFFPSPLAFLLE